MTDSIYTSRCRVEKVEGVVRRAVLEDGTEAIFGVHGAIKEQYGLHHEPDHPLPVDFLVAAGAG